MWFGVLTVVDPQLDLFKLFKSKFAGVREYSPQKNHE